MLTLALVVLGQCAIDAPTIASVAPQSTAVRFGPDGGNCVGATSGLSSLPLELMPTPGQYSFGGARCTTAFSLAMTACVADLRGDGGTQLCAVPAPPLASIFPTVLNVNYGPDGGACTYTAQCVSSLPPSLTPAPRVRALTNGPCQTAFNFARQSLMTDLGRGDGGTP